MSPREVPLLKLVGINGEPGRNPKFEWLEDTLLSETSATSGAISSTGTTTVNVTTGDGINFQADMLIRVTDTTSGSVEYMYITAVSTDALTVVRGVAGTSALSSIASGSTIDIVGLANNEGSDAPLKGTTELVIPFNYFQAFDTAYKISYIAANTDVYGVPEGDDARELEKAFQEVTIKLERSAFLGYRAAYDGTNAIPRLMGGLDWYLNTSTNTGALNYTKDLSSAQLSEKALNDMLQDRYYSVGSQNMGKTLIMGAWNKRRVNDIYSPYARMDRNERMGGVLVDTIDTDFGPIDVVLSLRCPKNTIYLVNLDFISIHPYDGLAFFDEEKASSGAYIVREIYGVYSMMIRNTKAMGRLTGTATS